MVSTVSIRFDSFGKRFMMKAICFDSWLYFLDSIQSDSWICWWLADSIPLWYRLLSWLRIGSWMQEVRGSNPRLGGLRVNPFQVSAGISTLQSRASGLQSNTQRVPSGPKKTPPSQQKTSRKTLGSSPRIPRSHSKGWGVAQFRGNHLSNTTCLTRVLFKRGGEYSKSRWSLTRRNTHQTNEAVWDKQLWTSNATQSMAESR